MAHATFCKAVLLAIFVTGAFSDRSTAAERVAPVVGNVAHGHTESLQSLMNDAIGMSQTHRAAGFEVTVGLVTDDVAFDGRFQEVARAGERVEATLPHHTGHGLQIDEKSYAVPVVAAQASETEVNPEAILLGTARGALRGQTSVVIPDACRVNALARMLANSNAVGSCLSRMEGAARTLITVAAGPESAAEAGVGRDSQVAEALLAHLAVPGVRVHDRMASAGDAVAGKTDGRQRPWTPSLLRRPFLLDPGGEAETVEGLLVQAAGAKLEVPADEQPADATGVDANGAIEQESPTTQSRPVTGGASESAPADAAPQDTPENGGGGSGPEGATADAPAVAPIAAQDEASGDVSSESSVSELTEEVFEVDFGRDGSGLAHDGSCDDLRFDGDGMGAPLTFRMIGEDATDCRILLEEGRIRLRSLWGGPRDPVKFGDDDSERANDLECDDLRFAGSGMGKSLLTGDVGRDAADCRSLFEQGSIGLHPLYGGSRGRLEFGDNGSGTAYDGECDDPRFDGNGMAKTLLAGNMGHDALDCRMLLEQGRIRLNPLFQEPGDGVDFGTDGSNWANDGECDDPRFVGDGMADTLLAKDVGRDAADCRSLFEEGRIRLHPLFKGPRDTVKYGDDGADWVRDGACDDPRFVGDGTAETLLLENMGRDAADCRSLFEEGWIQRHPLFGDPAEPLDFGDDGSKWAHDGECDDPRFVGDGMAETLLVEHMGRDAADCLGLHGEERIRLHPLFGGPRVSLDFGDDGSEWANDGECDDPRFVGDGTADSLSVENMGRDAADCRSLFEEGRIQRHPLFGDPGERLEFGTDGSEWANDGECDDPRFVGDGSAETLLVQDMGQDAADCRSLFEEGRIWLHPLFGGQGVSLERPRAGGREDDLDFGDDSSQWANDGECDDPRFAGDGMADTLLSEDEGRDASDCRNLFEQGRIWLRS